MERNEETVRRVVALGFFDGVHLGHGSLLRRTREIAFNTGCVASVVTFDRHPASVLTGTGTPLLSSQQDREWLIRSLYGIDEVEFLHFGRSLIEMQWEDFLRLCLLQDRNAVHVVCGADYRFGYRGEGTAEKLRAFCEKTGIGCDILPELSVDGVPVHSTVIRELLLQGRTEDAERLLGHPHTISGRVISGRRLGRTMGSPTANLELHPEVLRLPAGVYYTEAELDGRIYPALTNVGVCPTVTDGANYTVETWLLDYSGNLYGKELRIRFLHYLRPERKFDSEEQLKEAIASDASSARDYFSAFQV